jgi:hypothetical protein
MRSGRRCPRRPCGAAAAAGERDGDYFCHTDVIVQLPPPFPPPVILPLPSILPLNVAALLPFAVRPPSAVTIPWKRISPVIPAAHCAAPFLIVIGRGTGIAGTQALLPPLAVFETPL